MENNAHLELNKTTGESPGGIPAEELLSGKE